MMLPSTNVHVVEQAPPNGCHQCLCPLGELRFPPASPGGSQRSAGRSTGAHFKLLLLSWVPKCVRFLCVPLKSGVFLSALWDSQSNKPHWPSKPNILEACLPGVGPLGWGAQCGAQTPHSLERTSAIVTFLFVGHLPEYIGLDYTMSQPFLTHLVWALSLYL